MKKIVLTCSLILLVVSLFAQKLPALGDPWTANTSESFFIPSGLHPLSILKSDGIDFKIVAENKKVKFISTGDKNFKIGQTQYIGLKLSDFKNKHEAKLYSGWGYYLPVGNGWYAYFDFKSLNDSSKVLSLFKYQFN